MGDIREKIKERRKKAKDIVTSDMINKGNRKIYKCDVVYN